MICGDPLQFRVFSQLLHACTTMPIFAYRCSHCGFGKDVLQKRTDAPLVVCPECQQETFAKQLTAHAFQLKGSGWYVTDFRDNGAKAKPSGSEASSDSPAASRTSAVPISPRCLSCYCSWPQVLGCWPPVRCDP